MLTLLMQICLSIAQQMDSVSDWKKAAEDKSELDSSGSIYQSGDIEEIIAECLNSMFDL